MRERKKREREREREREKEEERERERETKDFPKCRGNLPIKIIYSETKQKNIAIGPKQKVNNNKITFLKSLTSKRKAI